MLRLYRYINMDYIAANGAYVGLAPPGNAGSWQRECKVNGKPDKLEMEISILSDLHSSCQNL